MRFLKTFVIMLLLTVIGCGTTTYLRMYNGPKKSDSEISTIYCSKAAWLFDLGFFEKSALTNKIEGVCIRGINDNICKVGTFGKVELQPGLYQIKVGYETEIYASGGFSRFSLPEPITLSINAEPGQGYFLECDDMKAVLSKNVSVSFFHITEDYRESTISDSTVYREKFRKWKRNQ